ncbi:unnamed protein product, partial [Symbiodinium sp. KB8]
GNCFFSLAGHPAAWGWMSGSTATSLRGQTRTWQRYSRTSRRSACVASKSKKHCRRRRLGTFRAPRLTASLS